MGFGIKVSQQFASIAELRRVWRAADEAGLPSTWGKTMKATTKTLTLSTIACMIIAVAAAGGEASARTEQPAPDDTTFHALGAVFRVADDQHSTTFTGARYDSKSNVMTVMTTQAEVKAKSLIAESTPLIAGADERVTIGSSDGPQLRFVRVQRSAAEIAAAQDRLGAMIADGTAPIQDVNQFGPSPDTDHLLLGTASLVEPDTLAALEATLGVPIDNVIAEPNTGQLGRQDDSSPCRQYMENAFRNNCGRGIQPRLREQCDRCGNSGW